ncbi:MAG: hypothetical protein H7178_10685, partial [Chitinophagaceae bacterium]|nr:hypothetical protein [Chitinophagaceae bacterium]
MKKVIAAFAGIFGCLVVWSKPVEKDTNIIVSYAKDEYTFLYNKKQNRVEVKQIQTTRYFTNNNRAVLPIGETYSDNSTIDDVTIKLDGSKAKYIQPKYEYYSQDDIFFSDLHICYFNLPLEKKGSTGEVTFKKTITDPRYFCQIFFDEPFNLRYKEVKIILPRWMKVNFKELNFAGYDIAKNQVYDSKADADIFTYTINNLAATKKENHSPGATYTHPHLLALVQSAQPQTEKITYFNTLADQYAWYRELVKGIDNDKAVLKEKALEITKGITAEVDKIKTVFYWVQNNIRYLAFEDGMA